MSGRVSSTFPGPIREAWSYEWPNPTAGIFGESWWHEDCPRPDPPEAIKSTYLLHYDGTGVSRVAVIAIRLDCPGCGAFAWFEDTEWDPDDDDLDDDDLDDDDWGPPLAAGNRPDDDPYVDDALAEEQLEQFR